MTDYRIALAWSHQDKAHIADIPDLQGCTADGATPEDAPREVLVVRALWLDVAREDGRPLPAPGRRRAAVEAGQ